MVFKSDLIVRRQEPAGEHEHNNGLMGGRRNTGRLTAVWWARQQARGDDPPRRFSELRDFRGHWDEWTPREEVDFIRWVFMDTGMTYDEAKAEIAAVTDVTSH